MPGKEGGEGDFGEEDELSTLICCVFEKLDESVDGFGAVGVVVYGADLCGSDFYFASHRELLRRK